jgi:Fur family transcriptional regulator, ferric uptake regulator
MHRSDSALVATTAQLHAHGYRLTGPGRTIIAALHGAGRYTTARQLYEGLRGRSVGLASVYRTLELLADLGLVRRRAEGGGETSYLPYGAGSQVQLTCTRCGQVRAINASICPTADLIAAAEAASGFAIERLVLDCSGLCAACAAGEA